MTDQIKPSIWSTNTNRFLSGKDKIEDLGVPFTRKKYLDHYLQDVLTFGHQEILPKFKGSIRVCSYNVHDWTNYLGIPNEEELVQIITAINPDILILQEVKGLPSNLTLFPYHAVGRVTPFISNIIYSKYPILSSTVEELVFFVEPRSAVKVELQLPNGKILDVIGTHLDVYDRTEQTRKRQAEQILNMVTQSRTIIAGDFNSVRLGDYTQEEIDWLVKNSPDKFPTLVTSLMETWFRDVFPVLKYTSVFAKRIDYIWIPKSSTFRIGDSDLSISKDKTIKVVNTGVVYTTASDHFPIFADITV